MAKEESEARIVGEIIRRHGKVIDLEASPEVIIDIIREFESEVDVTGLHPPSPAVGSVGDPTARDIMKVLLKLSRELNAIKKHLGA
jgi:hypothetical protein